MGFLDFSSPDLSHLIQKFNQICPAKVRNTSDSNPVFAFWSSSFLFQHLLLPVQGELGVNKVEFLSFTFIVNPGSGKLELLLKIPPFSESQFSSS
jgi:hypothetical protein